MAAIIAQAALNMPLIISIKINFNLEVIIIGRDQLIKYFDNNIIIMAFNSIHPKHTHLHYLELRKYSGMNI